MLKKSLTYFLCDNIQSETFFFIIKLVFQEKDELYLLYYNLTFKDRII